ncbi:UvrD-helicase domain-containing protein [Rubritalea tangerina]|uniref:DNA 3'-5' helicase n=1 Tax=Rubritalea tangerina TaxID=430798 RepID=A0ABW4ZCG3_9BACT
MFSSLLIEASAGSGKTFQLSNRFIALLALGEEPADLIALTFTRKAAGEFTRRILNRLALAATSENEAHKLSQEITPTLLGDPSSQQPELTIPPVLPALNMERFRELLAKLVDSLDRLQLSTLDSFFTRLVSSFGPELGLAGFEMLDEDRFALAREETLQQVLNGGALNQRQRDLFLSAFAVANYGNEEAKVRDSILDFVNKHHERLLQCPSPESWGNAPALWHDSESWPKFSPAKLAALQQDILSATPESLGHATLNKTFQTFAASITDYQPGTPLPDPIKKNLFKWTQNLPPNTLEISFTYSRKEITFPQRLTQLLLSLERLIRYSEIHVFLKRTQGIWAVVKAFENQYNKQCRSQGRVSFADLTLLLQQHAVLARKTGFNELAYRLDSQFKHWMLDEFQDTSRRQWEVIEPVINESVTDHEGDRSLFVVGDTKQSIYGWRGGEPRLFREMTLREDWSRLKQWTMSHSWRSSQVVLDFVNLICSPDSPGMTAFPNATQQRWKFQTHHAAKQLHGEVRVYQFSDKAEDQHSPKELAIVEELKRLSPIQRGLSCAILVTSNKQVQHYTSLLRESTGLPVEAEAAVSIASDSPFGLALLDWFRYLTHPADAFARRHVDTSPLAHSLAQFGDSPELQFTTARQQISSEGVAAHIIALHQNLPRDLVLGEFQTMRLEQILNTARSFDSQGGTLEEWLRMLVNQTHREESGKGAIQVMTIHKSKGLEFDLVFLPELDGNSYDTVSRMDMLTKENDQHLPIHFLNKPAKEIIANDETLNLQYNDWVANNCYERACNLYVALTRAARSLYLFLKPPPRSTTPLNDASWIRSTIGDIETTEHTIADSISGHLLYQRGSDTWLSDYPIQDLATDPHAAPLLLPPATPRLGRRTASKEKSTSIQLRNSRKNQAGMDFGNQVHALFESINHADDALTLPDSDAANAVRQAILLPESQHWFAPAPQTEILREQAIEAIDSNGTWFSGVIDRALVHRDETNQVSSVEILDFKTDSVDSADTLITRYKAQLESYAAVIASVYQIPANTVTTTILSTKLNTYIPVS